ncbi:CD2 antigen cytoplasmic tail-binding protein 2 [Blomia tropicalis]|nr:CD2 antigen cytoplasmic tail-binding protein 2 [Blomia tropicalis]
MEQHENDELDKELPFGKRFKHTLDSDEEDDEAEAENYNIMDGDEIEGAEKATLDSEGGIKITPFNMDEELETGHFDKDGTYIFKKEDNVRDNWLDNINWSRVTTNENEKNKDDSEQNDAEDNRPTMEELYKQVIELVQPGETIQRAMLRFGKDCPKIKRGQKRKMNEPVIDESKVKTAKENITKLTSIADQILQTGDMDIYQRKYEEFQLYLNRIKAPAIESDMFGDDFVESTSNVQPLESSVSWEYKWEDKDDAPISGPHTSQEMFSWSNDGRFKDGVFVRKIDSTDSKFYSSKRIDFELYV